jgi:hypothetical protein
MAEVTLRQIDRRLDRLQREVVALRTQQLMLIETLVTVLEGLRGEPDNRGQRSSAPSADDQRGFHPG